MFFLHTNLKINWRISLSVFKIKHHKCFFSKGMRTSLATLNTAGQTRARSSGFWPIWEVQEKLCLCLRWTTTQRCSPGGRSSPSSKVSRTTIGSRNREGWNWKFRKADYEKIDRLSWRRTQLNIWTFEHLNSWNHYRHVDEPLIGWFKWFIYTWFWNVTMWIIKLWRHDKSVKL